jgi:hypothetical protein
MPDPLLLQTKQRFIDIEDESGAENDDAATLVSKNYELEKKTEVKVEPAKPKEAKKEADPET